MTGRSKATLVWRGSDGEEQRISVTEGGIIGRAPRAEYCVPHRSISRRHARLEPEIDGTWRILDLGSRNGVIVHSRRVHEAILAPGDPIQLGDIVLSLEYSPEPEPSTPPPAALDPSEDPISAPRDLAEPLDLQELSLQELSLQDLSDDEQRLALLGIDLSEAPQAPASELPGPDVRSAREIVARFETDLEFESSAPPSDPSSSLGDGQDRGDGRDRDGDDPSTAALRSTSHLSEEAENSSREREGIFRASERWILVTICLLLLATTLILAFSSDREPAGVGDGTEANRVKNGAAGNGVRVADRPGTQQPAGTVDSPGLGSPNSGALDTAPPRSESTIGEGRVAPVPPSEELPDLAALRTLTVAQIEESWCATGFLFGRAPTPAESLRYAKGGPEKFLKAARDSAEHWRFRAEKTAQTTELPDALLPNEVPLDVMVWAKLVRDLAGGEEALPLPGPEGDDSRYETRFRRALSNRPKIAGLRGSLRSVWTAGAGRPLDPEVEGWIDAMARSEIAPSALITRFALLVTRAHPAVRDPEASKLTSSEWDRLLPALRAEDRWPEDGIERGVPPAWYLARALERRLPDLASLEPYAGPKGEIRLEVHAPFEVRPLLATPDRIPRLWRRLASSRLWLCPESPAAAQTVHERAASPRKREVLILAEGEILDPALDRARVRVADGYLLPALSAAAARLRITPSEGTPSEEVMEWLAAARGSRGGEGHRLFKTGGYRLVPAEWLSSAYRPATRAILLAGAHALEHPGTDVVVRLRLSEEPRPGVEGEWVEWMTALELVSDGCSPHPFQLWFFSETAGGGSRGVGVEWGPEVRTGWVIEEDRPVEQIHPRLVDGSNAAESEEARIFDGALSDEDTNDESSPSRPEGGADPASAKEKSSGESVPADGAPVLQERGDRS